LVVILGNKSVVAHIITNINDNWIRNVVDLSDVLDNIVEDNSVRRTLALLDANRLNDFTLGTSRAGFVEVLEGSVGCFKTSRWQVALGYRARRSATVGLIALADSAARALETKVVIVQGFLLSAVGNNRWAADRRALDINANLAAWADASVVVESQIL
jgi:hypothetical protein